MHYVRLTDIMTFILHGHPYILVSFPHEAYYNYYEVVYIRVILIALHFEQKSILYLYTSNKQQYQMKVKVSRNHKVFPVSDNLEYILVVCWQKQILYFTLWQQRNENSFKRKTWLQNAFSVFMKRLILLLRLPKIISMIEKLMYTLVVIGHLYIHQIGKSSDQLDYYYFKLGLSLKLFGRYYFQDNEEESINVL